MSYSKTQRRLLSSYNRVVSLIPQIGAEWALETPLDLPLWLLGLLAKIPIDGCPFSREIWGNFRGTPMLLLYIPKLCQLNPFYSLLVILSYRSRETIESL